MGVIDRRVVLLTASSGPDDMITPPAPLRKRQLTPAKTPANCSRARARDELDRS